MARKSDKIVDVDEKLENEQLENLGGPILVFS